MTDNVIQFPRSWPLQPWQVGEGHPPGPFSQPALVERALEVVEAAQANLAKTKKLLLENEDLLPPDEFGWDVKLRMLEIEMSYCKQWLRHYRNCGYDRNRMWQPFREWTGPDFPVLQGFST